MHDAHAKCTGFKIHAPVSQNVHTGCTLNFEHFGRRTIRKNDIQMWCQCESETMVFSEKMGR